MSWISEQFPEKSALQLGTGANQWMCIRMSDTGGLACRAQKEKRYDAAVSEYTTALAASCAPPAFAAVLHCNRAAAYQYKGQHAEAIADSLRAKALAPDYAKVSFCNMAGTWHDCHCKSAPPGVQTSILS